jgi:hypothetical protein
LNGLPFTVSSEAIAHIRKCLRCGEGDRNLKGMLPTLYFAFNRRSADLEGRTFEWCPVGFFGVGWYRPEQVTDQCLEEIDLGGEMVYALADTVKRLAGKTLVVEAVEVGYPNPADKRRELLRARASGLASREASPRAPNPRLRQTEMHSPTRRKAISVVLRGMPRVSPTRATFLAKAAATG